MGYREDLRKVVGSRALLLPSALMIIYKEGKFLLQKRTDDGTWSFHGGGISDWLV